VALTVIVTEAGHRLDGDTEDVALANRFLDHLTTRSFSAATVRAYAFDTLSFLRFCAEHALRLAEIVPTDVFDYLDWLGRRRPVAGQLVVPIRARTGVAPATANRRIAALRGLFEFTVLTGARTDSPVPTARRATGLRPKRRGLLGHIATGKPQTGGRLVREPRRLPGSLDAEEVALFVADLETHRDRAMALAMVLGGLRAGEVRGLLLADVDLGARRVRVVGKGNKERVVPVERAFFTEVTSYLRNERPRGCATPECFVVLRGPTRGGPLSEAGMRRIFRTHRARSGATRVRPHRLRHTYGTELAAAGIDLLVLRELMGHASPETTAGYVHLSAETLAVEYQRARSR
jgi:site-specific recombinase XerD